LVPGCAHRCHNGLRLRETYKKFSLKNMLATLVLRVKFAR